MSENWMPPLELLDEYDNNWDTYFEAIYNFFINDFVKDKPVFQGRRLALKKHPVINGKEATFWHLISEGSIESERTPDIRRCERIRWPKPIIDHAEEPAMKIWQNVRRHNERRILIWFEEYDYLVVLAERKGYLLLWTAYPVTRDHRKRKLMQEYTLYKAKAAH